jgi:histidyl-tRNA synthetase
VGPEGGSQSALSGGGRYDGLAEELGGAHTPGVGFGAGIERLLLALEKAGVEPPAGEGVDVFFVCEEGADRVAVLAKLAELRAAGVRAEADFAGRSVKGQRTQAGRLDADRVIVVGPGTDLSEVIP